MTDGIITILTHDGTFHEDEVVAVAILTTLFKNHHVVRSRDPLEISQADFVVDVGDVYDHHRRRYDHHMTTTPNDGFGHKYSSAGLIWKHYHLAYLRAIGIPKSIEINGHTFDILKGVAYNILYKWINPIDMVDNGEIPGPTVISEVVKSMRPISAERTREVSDEKFMETVKMVSMILERSCFHSADHLIAKARFEAGNKEYLRDGRILITEHPCPNQGQFYQSDVHFLISPVTDYVDEGNTRYIINPIQIAPKRNYKTSIPNHLLGIRESRIKERTGLSDITYIHHTGFVVMAQSKEAAIKFCEYLLDYNDTKQFSLHT
jgi:uncharacterized UPF0160 family protein